MPRNIFYREIMLIKHINPKNKDILQLSIQVRKFEILIDY
jgi:hypothetical protein